MANKVFTFGNVKEPGTEKKLPSLEKWKDVSMLSKTATRLGESDQSGQPSLRVSKSVNVQAVKNSIKNIFTWIPGERVLLPEFGSRLYTLLYEGITPLTEERIVAEIRHCVTEWEPRASIVDIRNVSAVDDTEDNVIHIEVVFTIPELNDEQYVYSFTYDAAQ